ncbi:MAG: regulatory protein RecX [Bacillota bacterium]|jgi:regulatory protein
MKKQPRQRPRSSPRSYALWLLGRRPYASNDLLQRMVRRGYSEAEAQDAVSYLQSIGYLDDAAYAEHFVSSRSQSGHGPRKLRWGLRSRGIDPDLADEAIAQLAEEELFAQAEALARRRLRNQPLDDKVRASLIRYLLQRGYDYLMVADVVAKLTACLDSLEQNS